MNDDPVLIARTEDLVAVRRLGVACGLEDSGRDDEQIEAAWGAFDGERLVGAIVLERNQGLDTVNWMAVDGEYRRRGIAGRLYAALEREALARGIAPALGDGPHAGVLHVSRLRGRGRGRRARYPSGRVSATASSSDAAASRRP